MGLLTIGSEEGKGDRLRKSSHDLLRESLPGSGVAYAGAVEDATTGHGMTLDLSGSYFIYKMDVSFDPARHTATATMELEADN